MFLSGVNTSQGDCLEFARAKLAWIVGPVQVHGLDVIHYLVLVETFPPA